MPRLHHTTLGNPLLHCAPRLAPENRGEVARRQAHCPRHVLERDTLAVALLDEAEDLGEQGLVLEPEISHYVRRQPRDAREQERKVRKDRLPVAVPALAELRIQGGEALGPRRALLWGHDQPPRASSWLVAS